MLDHQYEVSGTVTLKNSGGEGASGIQMRASCRGGGRTTSDQSGDYNFLLGFGGCSIAPVLPAGFSATPASRQVSVTKHAITGVDFQVSRGGGGAPDVASAASLSGGCKLSVKIMAPKTVRSGLAIYQHFATSEQSKAFFILPESSQCASGCANVVVSVTDPKTHAAVEDATVNVSVSQLSGVAGDGYLCTDGRAPKCGRYLFDLATNEQGQVPLLYWAPSVVYNGHSVTLNATAKEACSAASCPARVRNGAAKPVHLAVKRYLIYAKTASMSEEKAEELAAWAGGTSVLAKLGGIMSATSLIEKGLTFRSTP
ncbi:MAG: hypothetical protein ACLP01_24835 [Solirubrobacteraceae bacterium]